MQAELSDLGVTRNLFESLCLWLYLSVTGVLRVEKQNYAITENENNCSHRVFLIGHNSDLF